MEDAPIFILGLQRGGTNQLLNILRSHPGTCWPDGEFHEVLRPRRAPGGFPAGRALRYLPVLLQRGDLFSPHRPWRGGTLPPRLRAWVARGLEQATRRNAAEVARYKAALAAQGFYPGGPARPVRMVVKLVNYNMGFARDLLQIYPGASFIGITRDAAGVCESMIARGAAPDRVLALCQFAARIFLDMRDSGFPVLLLRFEDILADIAAASVRAYAHCGLDPAAVTGFCLQDKTRILDADGQVAGLRKADAFYTAASAGSHLRRGVNAAARARLPEPLRQQIDASCGALMRELGYDTAEGGSPGPDPAGGR